MVLDADGRLLVVRRGTAPAAGRWSLPGGRVERGESVREAATREAREETGLEVRPGELVGFVEYLDDDHHYLILDLAAEVVGEARPPRPGDDVTGAAWMHRAQLEEAETTARLLEFLDEHGVGVR